MNLLVLLASALLVHVPIEEPMGLRVVATGTEGHHVDWYVDGEWVVTTADGEAATLHVDGSCDVWAATAHDGEWRALVRPASGDDPGQLAYVDGWSVQHPATPTHPSAMAPFLLVASGLVAITVGRTRPKRP